MAAVPSIDMSGWLHEQLAQASPDLLRQMVTSFAEALMSGCGRGLRCRLWRAQRRAGQHPQRLPAAAVGYPGREH